MWPRSNDHSMLPASASLHPPTLLLPSAARLGCSQPKASLDRKVMRMAAGVTCLFCAPQLQTNSASDCSQLRTGMHHREISSRCNWPPRDDLMGWLVDRRWLQAVAGGEGGLMPHPAAQRGRGSTG
jgi:hypothetical protein